MFNSSGTKSCIPIHFVTLLKLNKDFEMPPICNSAEKKLWNELYGILNEVTKQCPKSCSLFEYSGKIRSLLGYLPTRREIQIDYAFLSNDLQIQKEYLVYDNNAFIGSVGGTLGLFIGFSFLTLVKEFIDILKHYLIEECTAA